ncbi:hypothetical protein PBV87_11505 [Niameybacter massiliensis]|uniref:DUF3168 domain-containing protein n=1 Tax=Holtiella tumoricola TaxID=3018743 RepID=A0AA42J134_9FIRM|nr:hypothetical protein [Holtiella tumoricola]MDA3732109.1 hypothetical protein [Holtiella tumoricola]
MENIYTKVTKALDEKILGCKVKKINRDEDARQSISYLLHPGIPVQYSDDDYMCIEHEIQIDIWSDYELSIHGIIEKVIQLMKENGFELVSIRSDMYERDINIIHKPILFSYLEKLVKERGR